MKQYILTHILTDLHLFWSIVVIFLGTIALLTWNLFRTRVSSANRAFRRAIK